VVLVLLGHHLVVGPVEVVRGAIRVDQLEMRSQGVVQEVQGILTGEPKETRSQGVEQETRVETVNYLTLPIYQRPLALRAGLGHLR